MLLCSFTIEMQAERQTSLEVSCFSSQTEISVGHVNHTNPFGKTRVPKDEFKKIKIKIKQ
jgi:hypothetical protein